MSKVNSCIFPVAGFGTRFLPVTKTIPKELLPINNKALIDYSLCEAQTAGINKMIMVINKRKELIRKHLSPDPNLIEFLKSKDKEYLIEDNKKIIENCKFNFINQENMLGLGNAILQTRDITNEEFFSVILPDDLCFSEGRSVMEQMIDIHSQYPDKSIVAVEEVNKKDVSSYGIIDGVPYYEREDLILVNSMIEKPSIDEAPTNLAIIGRYILSAEIFQFLEKIYPDGNGEYQLTDAIKEMAKQEKVLAYKFSGSRIDCGTYSGFLKANNFFYNNHLK